MKDHPDPNSLRPTDAQASPRKVWTTPRLSPMGTVAQLTRRIRVSGTKDGAKTGFSRS